MASAQSPLIGLEMTPETATYVSLLENQVAAYAIQEAKFRALLELLTGDSWETTKLDIDGNTLMAVAVAAIVKKTGMDAMSAKTLVTQRWNQLNQISTAPTPSAVPIEQLVNKIQTDTSAPIVPSKSLSMADRLADWKERQLASVTTPLKDAEPQQDSEEKLEESLQTQPTA